MVCPTDDYAVRCVSDLSPEIAACAAVALYDLVRIGWLGPDAHEDFFGIWSFARFSVLHPGSGIYDFPRLQVFQEAVAPDFTGFYPCPYPPDFLAAIVWLGHLPIGPAKALWTVAGLALLTGSGWLMFQPPFRRFALLAMVLAPASLMNAAIGETAFFGTALLVAGFAWVPTSPVLAGVAFGLLTLKPQLGVLVPVAFLARGDWRVIVATVLTALAMVGVSLLVFPPEMWAAWWRVLPLYQHVTQGNAALMAAIDAGALDLHVPAGIALAAQGMGGLGIALVVWFCFRRADYRLAVAALLAGTALAAPHDYVYDTVFVVVALLLTGVWMAGRGMRLTTPVLALYLTAYLFPFEVTRNAAACFVYIVLEALVFCSIAWLALGGAKTGSTRLP